jgi:hypothetical protein
LHVPVSAPAQPRVPGRPPLQGISHSIGEQTLGLCSRQLSVEAEGGGTQWSPKLADLGATNNNLKSPDGGCGTAGSRPGHTFTESISVAH